MKVLAILFFPGVLFAQTYGPNNPTAAGNATTVGTNAWSGTTNIFTSNNSSATNALKGTTNYLTGSGYNFGLLSTDVVAGIQLGIEKSSINLLDVTTTDAWVVGTSRPALVAGAQNRCLMVIIGLENSTSRDVNAVTYGGRSMTQLAEIGQGSPIFYGKTEVWYLMESDLALTSGTTISYTFASSIPAENFEIVASAVFKNVDQTSPFVDTETSGTTSTAASYQIASPLSFTPGSATVTGIFCGNPPNSTTAIGPCTGYTINSGLTEQVDYHNYATGFASSGGVLEVAQLLSTGTGTVQPTFTFNGSPNRQCVVGFTLRRARQMDNSVRVLKLGTITGTDLAQTGIDWPTTDTYTNYGGSTQLWGNSWTYLDINNAGFGGAISALITNGTATVDHMRMSIYTTSVLPVELMTFSATRNDRVVDLNWKTASEKNSDYFLLERSADGINFTAISSVNAAGNSQSVLSYAVTDESPNTGVNYYRLKLVDEDGVYSYSDIRAVSFSNADEFTIYPNPTPNVSILELSHAVESVVIMDDAGRVIDVIEGSEIPGNVQLNLDQEKDGVYFIVITKGAETTVKRLTKTTRDL